MIPKALRKLKLLKRGDDCMKDRVVGYVRVSTQGQVKDGYSLAYQTEEIQRYCARHKLELLDLYKDEGISGRRLMRMNSQ